MLTLNRDRFVKAAQDKMNKALDKAAAQVAGMTEQQFSRLGNLNNMVDKLVKKSWVAMQNATKQRVTSQERAKLLALEKKRQASPELRTKLENDEMYERMTGNYSRMDLGVSNR